MTTIKEIRELLATVKDLDNPLFLELEKIAELEFKRKSASVKKPYRLNWMRTFVWNPCFPMKKSFTSKELP